MLATRQIRIPFYVLSAFLLSIAATNVLAEEESRTSTSVQYTKAQRDAGIAGKISKDEYAGTPSKTGERRRTVRLLMISTDGLESGDCSNRAITSCL